MSVVRTERRAVDDPVRLLAAARIVRTALDRIEPASTEVADQDEIDAVIGGPGAST